MTQIDQFLNTLKRALKAKNVIYKDLAKALHLSESSIKRILSSKSISLERIEEICKACDISFAEVCRSTNFDEEVKPFTFTKEEEKILAANPILLHLYTLLNDGLTPAKIEKKYDISLTEIKKHLLRLDKLNLIELHPNDRVKMKKKGAGLRFRRDGEIGKTFFNYTKSNYLNYDFSGEQDYIRFLSSMYTEEGLIRLKKKFEKIIQEFDEENQYLKTIEHKEDEIGIMMSFRPWKWNQLDVIKKR